MSENPRVLIFDSGVGGLSIYHEIRKLLPSINILYACDNHQFPYGDKCETMLIDRVVTVLSQLVDSYAIDLIVLACNSASTIALPALRERLEQPIVGVVPAIKPASQLSNSKVIGLLATEGTVDRQYTKTLINDFAPDCQVLSLGSQRLVEIAEQKLRKKNVDLKELKEILDKLLDKPNASELDTIILGCTHFPLLAEEFKAVTHKEITWVDSGQAIAQRVNELLADLISKEHGNPPSLSAVFTKDCLKHREVYPYLSEIGIEQIDILDDLSSG